MNLDQKSVALHFHQLVVVIQGSLAGAWLLSVASPFGSDDSTKPAASDLLAWSANLTLGESRSDSHQTYSIASKSNILLRSQ